MLTIKPELVSTMIPVVLENTEQTLKDDYDFQPEVLKILLLWKSDYLGTNTFPCWKNVLEDLYEPLVIRLDELNIKEIESLIHVTERKLEWLEYNQ